MGWGRVRVELSELFSVLLLGEILRSYVLRKVKTLTN